MPDTKISVFTDGVTANATDAIPAARDPSGAPSNVFITPGYIRAYLLAQANTWTAAQTIASDTLTASAPAQSITQTWNNGAVAFTASQIGITNTASASGSLLADWRVDAVSRFRVDKTGAAIIGSIGTTGDRPLSLVSQYGTTTFDVYGGGELLINSAIRMGNGGGVGGAIYLTGGTGVQYELRFGSYSGLYGMTGGRIDQRWGGTAAAPVPQTYNIAEYYASATDYSRLAISASATAHQLKSEAAGSGTKRVIAVDYLVKGSAPAAGDLPSGAIGFIDDGANIWVCANRGGTLQKAQLT